MTTREIHLELLLSKPVVDSTGKTVGRIEEVRAEQQGEEWIVKEYLIGYAAVLERLSAWTIGLKLLQGIKAPTLIITGDSDIVIPPVNSNILNNKISGSELKIIKEGGHGFGYSHAAEIVKIITDFLS
ncbi:alpha/beta fold hydrolase [Nostoc sp.]|uniref:alpha/beta fold hydrolase n=1 Tax=Nostoc sp. TaxID=1180 RepID=UPI002FF91555